MYQSIVCIKLYTLTHHDISFIDMKPILLLYLVIMCNSHVMNMHIPQLYNDFINRKQMFVNICKFICEVWRKSTKINEYCVDNGCRWM